jgi:hypothetical protein
MLRCHTISWYVWCIHLNGICWNPYLNTMQIFETCQHEWLVPSCSHKTKCIVHQSNNNMSANGSYPTSILIWSLSNCIPECHWTGGKVGCEIGKVLYLGEAKQKGTVPATKQWWYDEKGVRNDMEVHELWCQWLLFHLDHGCITDYQKWDELAEEQICGGNQESNHLQ